MRSIAYTAGWLITLSACCVFALAVIAALAVAAIPVGIGLGLIALASR